MKSLTRLDCTPRYLLKDEDQHFKMNFFLVERRQMLLFVGVKHSRESWVIFLVSAMDYLSHRNTRIQIDENPFLDY